MTRVLARIGLSIFGTILVLEHVLVPEFDPTRNRVSEYANGPYGALMVTGFLAWAFSLAASGRLMRSRVLTTLLTLASAVAVLVATFPTATVAGELPAGRHMTTAGRIHDLAALVIWTTLAAAIAVSAVLISRPRCYRRLALTLGLASLALVALRVAPGLAQRGSLVAAVAWQTAFLSAARTANVRKE